MEERIKEARKFRKITQKDLAEKIGISRNYMNLIENGKEVPSQRTIRDIAAALSISEQWLRTGEGSMFHDDNIDRISQALADLITDEDERMLKLMELIRSKPKDEIEKFCEMLIEFCKCFTEE